MQYEGLLIYVEARSDGNVGSAGYAVIITDLEKSVVEEFSGVAEDATYYQALYQAIAEGLERASKHTSGWAKVYLGSDLVFKQLTGEYSVHKRELWERYVRVSDAKKRLKWVLFIQYQSRHYRLSQARLLAREALFGQSPKNAEAS